MAMPTRRTSTSGRFVAATTMTPDSSSTPSISFSRLVSTPADGPSWPSPRAVASASISSCSIQGQRTGGRCVVETHEKDDGRRCCPRFSEHFAHRSFALADKLVQQLRPVVSKVVAISLELSSPPVLLLP